MSDLILSQPNTLVQVSDLSSTSQSTMSSSLSTTPSAAAPRSASVVSQLIRPSTSYMQLSSSNTLAQAYIVSDSASSPSDSALAARIASTYSIRAMAAASSGSDTTQSTEVPPITTSSAIASSASDTSNPVALREMPLSSLVSSAIANVNVAADVAVSSSRTQSSTTDTGLTYGATRATSPTISSTGMHHHFMSPWDLQFAGSGHGFSYFVTRSTRGVPGSQPNGSSSVMGNIQPSASPNSHTSLNSYLSSQSHQHAAPISTLPISRSMGSSVSASQAAAYLDIRAANAISSTNTSTSNMRPHFRSKIVYVLSCGHCSGQVCQRGMKAILLADTNIELFSTDSTPYGIQLVNDDYQTRNCLCRIRDVACLGCGNVIGYHVTQPCEPCMDACNNGHFWMFHVTEVNSDERSTGKGAHPLVWSQIPRADKDQVQLNRVFTSVQR
ncbi:hypothetical protein BASA50_000047 [Batrachochytrium salamandrivorans]|uniref:Protein FAM72 n=1 Tax=Batrachochytrium salamandrivorans TaxID=1357716 RepID=A0ABQ8EXY7_9FUNG|nr:hypothetical protein BASA60_004238 [Batrachochytrium salamandrivorans]KAH6586999.1 hypothetical protein BASA50_000047 [Batrachochytrium salamandrivorans]KAH6601276.1 hypothetical protein BASA61_002046 [Batrachochytrium salamandrivorans]KAH9271586.1 hypothetical protein BASA83_006196 [Batrachochytrium salamandrivorans]